MEKSGSKDSVKTDKQDHLLDISPPKALLFPIPHASESSHAVITLKNISDSNVAYKFRSNNLDAYRIYPLSGILKPKESAKAVVEIAEEHPCRHDDKLMVVSTIVKSTDKDHSVSEIFLATDHSEEDHYTVECKCKIKSEDDSTKVSGRKSDQDSQMQSKLGSMKSQVKAMQLLLILLIIVIFILLWALHNVIKEKQFAARSHYPHIPSIAVYIDSIIRSLR